MFSPVARPHIVSPLSKDCQSPVCPSVLTASVRPCCPRQLRVYLTPLLPLLTCRTVGRSVGQWLPARMEERIRGPLLLLTRLFGSAASGGARLLARSFALPFRHFTSSRRPRRSGRKASSEGAKNYTPVAITIRPAASRQIAVVFWTHCHCSPSQETKALCRQLSLSLLALWRMWYLHPMIPFKMIFFHLKLERARER